MPIPGMSKGIEIKCRRCGKAAKAEDFTVDYVYKMAVCPSCVKERKAKEVKSPVAEKNDAFGKQIDAATPKKEVVQKPAGWDEDDEKLEKMARQKEKALNASATQQSSANTYSQPQSTMSKTASLFGFASKSSSSTGPVQKPQPAVTSQPKMQSPVQSAPQMQSSQTRPVSVMPREEPKTASPQSSDPAKIRHKCRKCGFEFWFNTERKMPKACPYCNTGVDAMIFGKMN